MADENNNVSLPEFPATGKIGDFYIRPGLFRLKGANIVPGGVSFTICSNKATRCELCLFHRREQIPFAVLPFPEYCRIGDTFSMIVFHLDIEEIEYAYRLDGPYDPDKGLLFAPSRFILDPYARAVTGQSVWGQKQPETAAYHGRIVQDDFDWGSFHDRHLAFSDMVIYELHVRNFTMSPSSGVTNRGTFAGLLEKLPYLLELGVNTVELMPVFEFDEVAEERTYDGHALLNCWGYNTVCYFAPNTSYTAATEFNREGTELKHLIRTLNSYGIDVILDVVFNHTAEGNEQGPFFSFKGLDNNIYYMLTPDGKYYNFSGVGNTLNCNHPVVREFILDCLRYWVVEYRIDGFRFDLASILGRDENGAPLSRPPLLESLAYDPILSHVKLIAEAWDAGGLYQVGSFPSWNRWAEWNGKYRDDLRRFLKGDAGFAAAAVNRICGSPDLYPPSMRQNASVNFITCHDGFTLYDLYAYNEKHNEANGWNNTDGANDNNSWNCGEEGDSLDPEVNALRRRMQLNAFTVLLCSRGAVMFPAGDEFGNTQFGNNNPYCQDNEISWLDWTLLEKNQSLFHFVRKLIRFRSAHPVLRGRTAPAQCGWPDISCHHGTAWNEAADDNARQIGLLFCGRQEDPDVRDDFIFLAVNAHWEPHRQDLPFLPSGYQWRLFIHTANEDAFGPEASFDGNSMTVGPRSCAILIGVKTGF